MKSLPHCMWWQLHCAQQSQQGAAVTSMKQSIEQKHEEASAFINVYY
jgi:hypothetical protein